MADEVTVDQLAIKISVSADKAASSIEALTTALQGLNGILAPTMKNLGQLAPALNTIQGAVAKNTSKVAKEIAAATAVSTGAQPSVTPVSPVDSGAAASVEKVITPMGRLKTAAEKVKKSVSSLTTSLKTMGTSGTKHTNFLGQSFIQLRSKIFFTLFAIGVLKKAFDTFIGSASQYMEKMHLFGAVFGQAGEAANEYTQAITGALGIDPMKFGETYSTFYSMAAAMGMAADAANTLSKNYTQLVYDYASLRDMDFEEVAVKFRSALAGQTRSIIQFGLDITQASLQQELYREGLNYSIHELTKADKAIVAHNLIMRRSAYVQGDLARTITQPANMMRILKDQFAIAARTIGYLFIPALQAVLPWLITLTQALASAAQAFLGLFGISMPSWKDFASEISAAGGGTDDLYAGMEDVGNAVGGAADEAKRLKDYVLGIDELNILSPPEPSATGGGGGGAGGGGVGGIGIEPFDVYDMIGGIDALSKITEPVKAKLREFAKSIEPFLDAVQRLWDALKPFAKNVWTGFTSFYKDTLVPLGTWTMNTIGVEVLDKITEILNWFNEHPEAAEALGRVAAAFLTLKVSIKGLKGLGKILGGLGIVKFLGDILKLTLINGSIKSVLGNVLATLMSGTGFFATLTTLLVEGLALLISFGIGYLIGKLILLIPGVEEFLEGVGAWIANAYYDTKEWVEGALKTVKGWLDTIKTWISNTWETIKTKTSAAWEAIKQFIMVPIEAIWLFIKATFEIIKKKIEDVWNSISEATKTAWGWIKTHIGGILDNVWNSIKTIFENIKSKVVGVWNDLKSATQTAWNWIKEKVTTPVKDIWNAVKTNFDNIKSKVKGVWDSLDDGLSAAWSAIKGIFKSGVNALIKMINNGPIKLINRLIDGAKSLPGISSLIGDAADIKPIPYVASGGLIPTGQLFVAGESGSELIGSYQGNRNTVMPLENSGFVEAMGKAVYRAMLSAMAQEESGRGRGDIYMDGQRVGEIIQQGARRSGIGVSLVKRGV